MATKDRNQERRDFRRALDDVGLNLPRDPVEVEGSDIRRVIRHREGREESSDEDIRESLKDPHADTSRRVAKDFEL